MGKHSYLAGYAKLELKGDPNKSIADIARSLKKVFKLKEDEETLRRAISRELAKTEKSVPDGGMINVKVDDTKVKLRGSRGFAFYEEVGSWKPREQQFTTPGTYLVLGCAHVPGHNKAMINGITKLIPEIKDLKGLMLIGDFLDLNSLSGHDRGRFTAVPGLTLDKEYIEGNHVLNSLTKNLPKDAEKVYIYGNHEDRWKRYMADMQNAKAPLASPREALNLDGRGFHTFENWTSDYVTLGAHLELIHGQYYNTHCAKQHIDKFRGSVVFAHSHRIQMYVEGKTGGFNIGWGGDVNHPFFNYAERGTKGQWQNGFALVTIDEMGNYYVQQVFCHNNKFYYNGKAYC